MLQNISNLGTTLNKKEQKNINGGFGGGTMQCSTNSDCDILNSYPGMENERFFCYWGYCQIS
ncbi:hypothetical protein [Tenacibaculum singaporense]|uniref:Uncharacterized protein n=1 Tax=Tenacibaculum singaporense TaxID=2358479 RepID=A0A3Q8RSC1_9FLAO|nr:hypothetical protein [Tenacibaculum singaporense]AZJ34470.1 hypothetical protein D6T69_02565 [Tenacibaculum singaporense]RSC94970.1 hypothetical protein EI424_04790 [Tenacibaculum singaporense]